MDIYKLSKVMDRPFRVIRKRSNYWMIDVLGVDFKEDGMICEKHGVGSTLHEALDLYIAKIHGHQAVVNARWPNEKLFLLPGTITVSRFSRLKLWAIGVFRVNCFMCNKDSLNKRGICTHCKITPHFLERIKLRVKL